MKIIFKMFGETFASYNLGDINFHVPQRYRIDKFIGAGSYGIVVKAIDNETGQQVAIKRLRQPFNRIHMIKRAYREFEILQICNHKNVVNLLNAFTPQKNLSDFEDVYFVMEFMDYPLRAIIHERQFQFQQPNGGKRMSFLMYQLLCGVNHLHQAGIAYRDLTPDNIMISKEFQLKIVDLSLATQINTYDDRSNYVTMRYYRAPEIILSIKYNQKVDLWSIGCIFAELLTGNILCPGKDKFDQWIQIIKKIGTPNEEFIAKLNEPLQQYLKSMKKIEALAWEKTFADYVFPKSDKTFCCPKNGRDLLSKMLVIDPDKRISAEEALKHPYVLWKSHPDELISLPKRKYDAVIENLKLSTIEWKKTIFERLHEYEKTH